MNLKPLLYEYYQQYKTFPPLSYLSKKTKINIKNLCVQLDKYVAKGVLKKNGEEYAFNLMSTPNQVMRAPGTSNPEISFNFVRYVMGGIALVAMIMSAYYSAIWFSNFLPIFVSWVCACVIVFYASFSIQAAIMSTGITRALLRITAVIVIIFSIISTIAGQYRNDSEKKQDNTDQIKLSGLELLKSEEKSLVDSMGSIKQELDDNARALAQFGKQEMESRGYKNLFWKGYTLRNMREATARKLEAKRVEIREYTLNENIAKVKIETNTFYSWVATFLPFNPSTIEFWLYLCPAVFYDIIAPLGLYIFLKRKEKES